MSYTRRRQTGRRSTGEIVAGVIGGLSGLALLTLGVLVFTGVLNRFPLGIARADGELIELWNTRNYTEVVDRAEDKLTSEPFDPQSLTFGGIAHFYVGVDELDETQQQMHLSRSVQLLRKAQLDARAPLEAERSYVLSKAYFHKGKDYMDLSIANMRESLEMGYDASDSRSYLALAYAEAGDFVESAAWFARAIDDAISRGDAQAVNALRVRASSSYDAIGEYEVAERLLRTAIDELDDEFLRLMARNRLSKVLINAGRIAEAEQVVRSTIEAYPESADAHYYLGVVYHETERPIEARASWRTARNLDPSHAAALAGLAGNLEN